MMEILSLNKIEKVFIIEPIILYLSNIEYMWGYLRKVWRTSHKWIFVNNFCGALEIY